MRFLVAAAEGRFCDNNGCFVDRAPLQTAQESLVLVGNIMSTFVLSSKAFNISEKSTRQ